MITRCPECGTKFRISVDLIRAEDSSVRCGDCMSVFDARAQLVDEASESSYLVDSARERAARLRHDQHQASLQHENRASDVAPNGQDQHTDSHDHSDSHGAGWVNPGWDRTDERSSRNTAAEDSTGSGKQSRPHGQLLIDRREFETDIDLDNADTIAYSPVSQYATDSHSSTLRADSGQVAAGQVLLDDLEVAEVDLAQRETDYSRRIDPLINPDDKTIEFERTLALEGLTGIESDYQEGGQGTQHRSAVERSIETVSDTATASADRSSSYVGEHQFRSPSVGADYGAETRLPQTGLRTRADFSNDPDIVNRPVAPPRSERHLADHQQSYDHGPSDADMPERTHRYDSHSGQSEHYSLDQPGDLPGQSESALEMRQHLNERGVDIESDDDYEDVPESRSSSVGWWLLGLLAVACAAALYARDDIAKSSLPQSVRAGFCSVAGCELPVASNIADLELLRQKVYSHPSIEDALVVSIDVVNNAVFPQPYPVLSITMANGDGESVAQRDFAPTDYLENYAGTETLAAGKPTRINIDIVDPGDDAQSFEMEFRQL